MHTKTKPPSCSHCSFYPIRRIMPRGSKTSPIMLVGDYPSVRFPDHGEPFSDRAGAVLGVLLKRLRLYYHTLDRGPQRWMALTSNNALYKTYLVQCLHENAPKKEVITHCRSSFLDVDIADIKPKLVIAFGAVAAKGVLRVPVVFNEVRGTFTACTQQQHAYTVFVTYSLKALLAQPGLVEEVFRDLQRAFLHVEDAASTRCTPPEVLRRHYIFPRTVDDVIKVCDDILNYCNEGQQPDKHLIALDTETTTLEMHDPAAKIIMLSVAWAEAKAAAIILDHPQRPWTPDERRIVEAQLRRLCASSKPKTLHNEKFDRKGIVHRYGWELNNVVWDTMGAEHLLEEDKKGAYGLKILTRGRFPRYAGYEDKVSELREAHGGKTRAEGARKYRKALVRYEKDQQDYLDALVTYEEQAWPQYQKELQAWNVKKDAEKARAQAVRAAKGPVPLRKIDLKAIGPKPRLPKKPKAPKAPVLEEPFDYTCIPLEELEFYAAVDADVTRQHTVYQNQRMLLEHTRDVAQCTQYKRPAPLPIKRLMPRHVIPTSRTLADMEFTGFPVDLPYLNDLDSKLEVVVNETQQKLYASVGREFVIDNPALIGQIMFSDGFDHQGIKVVVPRDDNIKRTSRGQTKSDEATLKYIANTYGFEFPKWVLQYRKARKARSTFLANVRDHAQFDGAMHSNFHLTGTGTGRLSSSGENLQNCPRKLAGFNIKKIFIPPPGYTLINTDAKGAEIRIFAAYAKDETLRQSLLDGRDTHSFFTSHVFGVSYDEVEAARELCDRYYAGEQIALDKVQAAEALVKKRTNCKRTVFGTLYGAMAQKIADVAGISLQEAQEVIDLMFKMFPSIPAYIKNTEREVDLFHWVATFTGRKRRFPLASQRQFVRRCYRQAVNFKIQSTSSDIVLWVLNQIYPIVKNDLRGFFHATVHDSIVFSVPHAYVSQIPELMVAYGTRRAQQEFPWLSVPFLWDVEAGLSYGEVTSIDKYIKGHTYVTKTSLEEIISDEDIRNEINADLAN